ncbi:NAD(P)H-dependent oxidoreductase [Dasania marina]|uniref:NAD(P)H-dependent oxidoreductase n=1 Tax=Dasania marina TaxID=471499 RepID=UPI0030DBAB71|tara:strand:+ start:5260 stop:5886 length:627 start_codon:yes stop_codon:yes gene_type:complete
MNVLVVLAHPRRDSFTGTLLDHFVAGLEEGGHVAEIADLHAEGFNPCFQPEDQAQFEGGTLPDDVLAEQSRIERNDVIALVFPFYWWSFPALLKGWIDRVWSEGWAYHWTLERPYGLINKDLIVLGSCGSSERTFEGKRRYGAAISNNIDMGTFSYCGINKVTRHMFYEVDTNPEIRLQYLAKAHRAGLEIGVPADDVSSAAAEPCAP